MSENTPPATRSFHCESCSGEIQIPYDLPPTTAPCPHCGTEITSPPVPEVAPPATSAPVVLTEEQEVAPSTPAAAPPSATEAVAQAAPEATPAPAPAPTPQPIEAQMPPPSAPPQGIPVVGDGLGSGREDTSMPPAPISAELPSADATPPVQTPPDQGGGLPELGAPSAPATAPLPSPEPAMADAAVAAESDSKEVAASAAASRAPALEEAIAPDEGGGRQRAGMHPAIPFLVAIRWLHSFFVRGKRVIISIALVKVPR